jgi:DNA polymerase-3 subunit epsilon
MSLADERYCSVDLETTGLNLKTDELLSFASVPIRACRIAVCDSYSTLIHPENYKLEAMKYHGISKKELEDAPPFRSVADKILSSLDGTLVGHSVEYDYRFLKRYYKQIGVKFKRDFIDINLVEKWLDQSCGKLGQNMTFEAIMKRYGLEANYRHNALADAFFAAQVFQMQMMRLEKLGVESARDLVKAINRCAYAIW